MRRQGIINSRLPKKRRRRRTMQTAVHFLRLGQFRAFSGSFPQSSSRISSSSILSSRTADSPCPGETLGDSEFIGAFSATWTWVIEELRDCVADIGILSVVFWSALTDITSDKREGMHQNMTDGCVFKQL